jgi:hypothetical protein
MLLTKMFLLPNSFGDCVGISKYVTPKLVWQLYTGRIRDERVSNTVVTVCLDCCVHILPLGISVKFVNFLVQSYGVSRGSKDYVVPSEGQAMACLPATDHKVQPSQHVARLETLKRDANSLFFATTLTSYISYI